MLYFILSVIFVFPMIGQSQPDRTVSGLYGSPDLAFSGGIMSVKLESMKIPAVKKAFWEKHREMRSQGKREFYIAELHFKKPENWKYKLPPWPEAKAQLDQFLGSADGISTYPEALFAITPGEENVTWGGQTMLMNQIYDYLSQTYKIKVFQWLTEPYPPRLEIRADGWILDAYSIHGEKFYRHLQKFILYGKPVIPIVWAAEPFGNYYKKKGIQGIFHDAGEQIDYCAELNLPVILFAVSGKLGSVNVWLYSKDFPFPELRDFFYKKLDEVKNGKFGLSGHPLDAVRIIPDRQGNYQFDVMFDKFSFVDSCRIQNVDAMRLSGDGLSVVKPAGRLEWLWESREPVNSAILKIRATGNVHVQVLIDGKIQDTGDGKDLTFKDFRRLELVLLPERGALLQSLSLKALIPFVKDPVTAWSGSHKEDFGDNEFMRSWDYEDSEQLSIGGYGLGIYPREKNSFRWEASRHFRSDKSVDGIVLKVACRADAKSHSSLVKAGISLDGRNIQWFADTADPQTGESALNIPVRFPDPVHDFYVHIILQANSGKNNSVVTASIQNIEIKGIGQ